MLLEHNAFPIRPRPAISVADGNVMQFATNQGSLYGHIPRRSAASETCKIVGNRCRVSGRVGPAMQNHQPFTLYRADGTPVLVRNVYLRPTDKLADHLATDDGQVVYSRDEQTGTFWIADTQEELYLNKP